MRTVDPEVWFRGSVPELWSHRQTDRHLETRLRRSLRDACLEYLRRASFRGALLTSRTCDTTWDSVRNTVACVLAFVLALALVSFNVHQQLSRPPLQVNFQPRLSTDKLPFPAVAICTNNIISNRSMHQYINYLLSRGIYNDTIGIDVLRNIVLNYGSFVTKTQQPVDLEHLFKEPHFNVTELMLQLSPKCSDLLKSCAFDGGVRNCSELFATRITALGFCCVFNSRYQPEDLNATVWGSYELGPRNGLVVVYTEDDEDIAFLRRPALGVEVLIFDGDEFPVLETGVARAYPVRKDAAMFFVLRQEDIRASDELATYRESSRQCRLRQLAGPRSAGSSYGWCLLECRRRTIAALCNCVPFMLMPNADDDICTHKHLPCLYKHKEKFIYYYPGDDAGEGLTEEMQDSLNCPECLPDCDRRVHGADVAFTPFLFDQEHKFFMGMILERGESLANTSVLRFYYNSHHQPIFLVEPAVRWYEGIALMACHLVFLLTINVMTIIELIFYLTVRWAYHFRRRTILLRTHTKIEKLPSNIDVEDVTIAYFEETINKVKDDISVPPVKRFYF